MASVKYYDRVLVTTTTTGTGTYSLGSAVTGYLTMALAGASSGDLVPYVVTDSLTAPTAFEVGIGTYTSGSPATLARTTIHRNTTGGTSAINWSSGTKYVYLGMTAASAPVYSTEGYLAATTPPLTDTGTNLLTAAWFAGKLRFGSYSGTTDGSGNLTATFSSAYGTSCDWALVCNGNATQTQSSCLLVGYSSSQITANFPTRLSGTATINYLTSGH